MGPPEAAVPTRGLHRRGRRALYGHDRSRGARGPGYPPLRQRRRDRGAPRLGRHTPLLAPHPHAGGSTVPLRRPARPAPRMAADCTQSQRGADTRHHTSQHRPRKRKRKGLGEFKGSRRTAQDRKYVRGGGGWVGRGVSGCAPPCCTEAAAGSGVDGNARSFGFAVRLR